MRVIAEAAKPMVACIDSFHDARANPALPLDRKPHGPRRVTAMGFGLLRLSVRPVAAAGRAMPMTVSREETAREMMTATSQPAPPVPPPSPRPFGAARRRWRRLWRGGCWAPVVLLALDLGLRTLLGLGNPIIYREDPACGYLPVPNQNVRRFFRRNQINEFGMRSPAVVMPRPADTFRVLFIGDSVTYGTTFVDQSEIFTSLLRAELPAQTHSPVEVLNASAGGWAVGNEAGYLESRGTFDADLVVFVLNTGDLVQPFTRAPLTLESGYPDRQPWCALQELWVRYIRPRLFGSPPVADSGSQASPHAPVEETAAVLDSLRGAEFFCRRAGAKFAIIYVPSRGGGWDNPEYARSLDQLRRWAARQGVSFADLTDEAAAHSVQDVYFDGGIHLTPAGHRLIADAVERRWGKLSP